MNRSAVSSAPNVVVVIADDITPAYFGCYGGRTPTPNIDRLAREGLRFDRSHCPAPLCNPSRYAVLTGNYPGRAHSVSAKCTAAEPYSVLFNADLQPGDASMATRLKEAGYFTGHVGKWHCNFAYGQKLGKPWKPEGFPDDVSLDDPSFDAALQAAHAAHVETVRDCAGFEWVDAVQWGNLDNKKPDRLKRHNVPWLTQTALDFLEEAEADGRPFYLHLENSVPHSPDPAMSLGEDRRYTLAGKQDRPMDCHPPDETIRERLRASGIGEDEKRVYGINAGVVMIDDQIGVLLRKLEKMGEIENTIFIFTADHGIQGKGTCYAGGFHMPFVMSWPRGVTEPGRAIADPISHVDILPTVRHAAGLEVPPDLDGISFLNLLRDPAAQGPREVTYQEMGTGRSIVKGKFHYIAFRYPASTAKKVEEGIWDGPPTLFADQENSVFCDFNFRTKPSYFDPDQLYDLEADPFERNNLADNPAYAGVLQAMQEALYEITDTLPGPFPRAIPAVMRSELYHDLVERRRSNIHLAAKHGSGVDADLLFNRNERLPEAWEGENGEGAR